VASTQRCWAGSTAPHPRRDHARQPDQRQHGAGERLAHLRWVSGCSSPIRSSRAGSANSTCAGERADHRDLLQEGRHRAVAECLREARSAGPEHRDRGIAHRDGPRRVRVLPDRAPARQSSAKKWKPLDVATLKRRFRRSGCRFSADGRRPAGIARGDQWSAEGDREPLPAHRDRQHADASVDADDLRSGNGAGRRGRVHRHPAVLRRAGVPLRDLPSSRCAIATRSRRPYWVEDPGFDIEFHLRHIALPKPGGWRELCQQAARLHARPLDRSRPLWSAT